MPLPNIEQTTLRHRHNFLLGDEELVHPATHIPPLSFAGPSSFSQQPHPNYGDIGATLRSIQEERASIQARAASEHAALRDFVQEQHDEL